MTQQTAQMTHHEQRMSERDWSVGDQVMVAVEWFGTDDDGWAQAEVTECTCESFDTFTVVFEDGERDEVAGCEVRAMNNEEQRR